MHLNRTFTFILLISIIISSPVKADDETRNLVIGLGAGLLMEGIEVLSAESDQQETTLNNVSSTEHTVEVPELQYDQEIYDMQAGLKELGYYHGAVDGLNGEKTTTAIQSWQRDNGIDINGGDLYLDIVQDQVENKKEKVAYEKAKKTRQKNKKKSTLDDAYYGLVVSDSWYSVCKEFKDSSHFLSSRVDNQLDDNYRKVQKRLVQEIDKVKSCNDIGATEAQETKKRAEEKFKRSVDGKIVDLALKMGPHVFVSESDAYSRVEGCNVLSQRFKLLYQANKDKEITCDSVR